MKFNFLALSSALFMTTNLLAQQGQKTCEKNYLVRPGDTLSRIAYEYVGTSVWEPDGSLKQVSDCNPQINNIHLIYPGNSLILPGLSSGDLPQNIDQNEHIDSTPVTSDDKPDYTVEDTNTVVEQEVAKPTGNSKLSHSIYAEVNSFHSELAGIQTTGSGTGSEADEILSDPNISGKLIYSLHLSEKLGFKVILDFKNYIYSESLDSKIVNTQKQLTFSPGLGVFYTPFPFLDLNLNILSYEQGFYGANDLGNLVFDFERLFRLEANPEFKILQKDSFDLGLGLFGVYQLSGDKISSSFGWGVEPFVNAFFNKNLRFYLRYHDLTYDFISSETRNELLEIGVGYTWKF